MTTHVFVYGTLLSNIPGSMSKFLRRRATLIGKASTPGALYDLGRYPGFVAGGEARVTGELYRLDPAQQEQTLAMLDAYESVTGEPEDEYRRVEVSVRVGGGGVFRAFTYEYTGDVSRLPTVPKGDYPPYYRSQPDHQAFVNGE